MIKDENRGSAAPLIADPDDEVGVRNLARRHIILNALEMAASLDWKTSSGLQFDCEGTLEQISEPAFDQGRNNLAWTHEAAHEVLIHFSEPDLHQLLTAMRQAATPSGSPAGK